MAWTPPLKHLRRKELLSGERFYDLLSEQCNHVDPEVAVMMYLGLLALISQELRRNKFIRLPGLVDIALVRQKARPAWFGKRHALIDGREVLKGYFHETFRRYFNKRQEIQVLGHMPPPAIS